MANRIPVKAIYSGTYGSSDVTSLGEFASGDTIDVSYIADGTITAAKLAADTATQAELDTVSTVASAALPKAGGAMSGNITMAGTETVDGRDLSVDGAKLDLIDASADVTDATTVAAAGALMDSELTSLASVKAINQGLTTTSNVTFGDATISGDLTVSGDTTTVNTATLSVEDPLIILASGNNSADAVDIGMYGLYDTSGSQDLYGGLFRDANDSGKWKLFKDNQAAPTTTVNTSGTGYAVGTLVANIEGNVTGNVTGNTSGTAGSTTGNAATATALATGRTIGMTGDVVWTSASFDGSGNVTASSAIQANAVDTAHIGDDQVTAAKLANSINTDIATGVTASTTAGNALPKAGGTVTGVVTFENDIKFTDNDKAKFGTSDDLQIYHDGNHSYIRDTGTGDLMLRGTEVRIKSGTDNDDMITCIENGATNLFYSNAKKLETTSTGVDVTGVITTDGLTTSADISFGDDDKATFGASDDLQIYHNGGNSYVNDGGTGDLRLCGNNLGLMNAEHTKWYLYATNNGGVDIKYNNATKLSTTSTGIDVTGTINSGDLAGEVWLIGRDSNDFFNVGTTKHQWYLDGAEDMRLENDGDLHVDGDVLAYSTTVSDERLKTGIMPITNALSKVNQLNGCTFTYTTDGKESAGLIAQDVEKVLPSAISESTLPLKQDDGKEYKVLQYDQTIGLLVEAIKELTAKVEELESK